MLHGVSCSLKTKDQRMKSHDQTSRSFLHHKQAYAYLLTQSSTVVLSLASLLVESNLLIEISSSEVNIPLLYGLQLQPPVNKQHSSIPVSQILQRRQSGFPGFGKPGDTSDWNRKWVLVVDASPELICQNRFNATGGDISLIPSFSSWFLNKTIMTKISDNRNWVDANHLYTDVYIYIIHTEYTYTAGIHPLWYTCLGHVWILPG